MSKFIRTTVVFTLVFIHSILAQEQPVNPYWPIDLEEVTVTVGRLSAQVGAFSAFDSARIAGQSGVALSDVLFPLTGGVINVDERNEATLSLRGAIPRDTKLFIDGRPAASPWNGYIDLSGISLNDIETITVIKGPAPLSYGSNLGGVIDIVTKLPSSKPGLCVSVDYGSGGFNRTALTGGGKIAEKLYIRASLAAEGQDGYPLPDGFDSTPYENGGLRDNSDNRRYTGSLGFYFPLLQGQTALSIGYSNEERGLPPKIVKEFFRDPVYWRFKDWTRYYSSLKWSRTTQKAGFSGDLYYDVYTNRLKRYSGAGYDEGNYDYDSVHLSRTLGWDGSVSLKASNRLSTVFGFRSGYNLFSRKEQSPASGGFSTPDYDYTLDADIYSEGIYKAGRGVNVSAGLSLINRLVEGEDTQTAPALRLGVSVNPSVRLRLAANFARSVQYPTFFHLYDANSGNPDLDPETAWRGEIGAQYSIAAGITLSLWHYRSFIEGRIDRKDRFSPYLNIADAELWGEELVLERRSDKYTASLGYTLQTAKLEPVPGSPFTLLGDDIPSWKADFYVSAKITGKLSASISGNYLSELTDYNGNKIGEHLAADLTANYSLRPWLGLKGAVENVTDKEYSLDYGFPRPGRVWQMGMEFSIN